MPSHSQVFGQFQYPTSPLSVLPQVGKNAAEATAKLVPLQRKSEARRTAEEAGKKQGKAKKKPKRRKPKK